MNAMTKPIWERVELEPVRSTITFEELHELDDVDFARLIRANLIPTQPRKAWDRLWWGLKLDPDLRADTLDLLQVWQQETELALTHGLSNEDAAQAQQFLRRVDEARSRLLKDNLNEPLAWAGRAGDFQPNARRVIALLVSAIARHRNDIEDPTVADEELWGILREVDLDPRDYLSRTDIH